VNESEICAVAETIGAGPCEVNITFPITFLGAINLSNRNNLLEFLIIILSAINLYTNNYFTVLQWNIISVSSDLFSARVQEEVPLLQFHYTTAAVKDLDES